MSLNRGPRVGVGEAKSRAGPRARKISWVQSCAQFLDRGTGVGVPASSAACGSGEHPPAPDCWSLYGEGLPGSPRAPATPPAGAAERPLSPSPPLLTPDEQLVGLAGLAPAVRPRGQVCVVRRVLERPFGSGGGRQRGSCSSAGRGGRRAAAEEG